jgi:hypothetical protein
MATKGKQTGKDAAKASSKALQDGRTAASRRKRVGSKNK